MRKGSLLVIALVFLAIVALAFGHRRPQRDPDAVPAGTGVVVIQVANPYRFGVEMEVKCDWEWQKKRYRFHQFIVAAAKRQTLIKVPNNLGFCEIWPHVVW